MVRSPTTKQELVKVADPPTVGDAFVRELDVSKLTLRLVRKPDKKGEGEETHSIAKLSGLTLQTLQQCLYKPTELTLKSSDGHVNKVVVSLKYLPVKMQLDPSESINNSGSLRVDVLDAADLPSADRNGYSDPYCKFELNGKTIHKTKVQKKTLHPAWNEFFETEIASRTAADFKLTVYDWDFGDKADVLGSAVINLDLLEPFQPQEVALGLDGKSGTVRLKFLFKPTYVMRSRQGSSTFSGTFAPAGKIIGAPVKGVGFVGGGMVKGASFLRHGLKGKKGSKDVNALESPDTAPQLTNGDRLSTPTTETTPQGTPSKAANPAILVDGGSPSPITPHSRSRSFNSTYSGVGGTPNNKSADSGLATISVLSATGYPPSANVRVHIRLVSSKGAKDIHKTKAQKSPAGEVSWDNESCKVNCTADTQFQVAVMDHSTFGIGSDDLGQALFYIDDSGAGSEKTIEAGQGKVVLRSAFAGEAANGGGRESPEGERKKAGRRSFLAKRDVSRGSTPA